MKSCYLLLSHQLGANRFISDGDKVRTHKYLNDAKSWIRISEAVWHTLPYRISEGCFDEIRRLNRITVKAVKVLIGGLNRGI